MLDRRAVVTGLAAVAVAGRVPAMPRGAVLLPLLADGFDRDVLMVFPA